MENPSRERGAGVVVTGGLSSPTPAARLPLHRRNETGQERDEKGKRSATIIFPSLLSLLWNQSTSLCLPGIPSLVECDFGHVWLVGENVFIKFFHLFDY